MEIEEAIQRLADRWNDLHIEFHAESGWRVSTCYADGQWGADGWIRGDDGSLHSCLVKAVEVMLKQR